LPLYLYITADFSSRDLVNFF